MKKNIVGLAISAALQPPLEMIKALEHTYSNLKRPRATSNTLTHISEKGKVKREKKRKPKNRPSRRQRIKFKRRQ